MNDKQLSGEFTWSMLGDIGKGREHLGENMPVLVYRLFQYTMRATLVRAYGKDEMIRLFRESGRLAGEEFAKNVLDLQLDWNHFIAQMQSSLKDLQIGVLRFEEVDSNSGHMILTVGEDLDCSGLPISGECVCNYDEGFLAGILSVYTDKPYSAVEIDCWARGDRVCRFEADPKPGKD
ncbi:MAG: 4-vinyl reductase [Lachnospiraceae bacterium]|jgi:predicted hydrocarbon binding protein|nr:4-vinyl reductase [Lachnospiraceae bacterium]